MGHTSVLLGLADRRIEERLRAVAGIPFLLHRPASPTECVRAAREHRPSVVVISPAIAPWAGALGQLVRALKGLASDCVVAIIAHVEQLAPVDAAIVEREADIVLPPTDTLASTFAAWLTQHFREHAIPVISGAPEPTVAHTVRLEAPIPQRAVWGEQKSVDDHPHPQRPAARVLRQKVVTFWSGKGGVGRSTLITAVADELSRVQGVRVCMVDLNPDQCTLAALVGKETAPNSWVGLEEALRSGHITESAVTDACLQITPTWAMLTGPDAHTPWVGAMTAPVVAEVVEQLRRSFDYILLDVPAGRTAVGDTAIRLSQEVLLLVSAFYPDVIATGRLLGRADSEGVLQRYRCQLVLSPWVDSTELPEADVELCMGLRVAARIPLSPIIVLEAARRGRPVTQLTAREAGSIQSAVSAVTSLITDGIAQPAKRTWFGK